MKKTMLRYLSAFLASVILGTVLLLLGACLPQAPIDANVAVSAQQLSKEGTYPETGDHAFAGMLDNWTDALILSHSKSTTIAQWDTIFTNPKYEYGEGTPVSFLNQYVLDENPVPTEYYTQYWMGFRPLMRLALCFLNYFQIRRYVALAFFVLFAAVMCSISKHVNTKAGFLFALSIIFVRPQTITSSLQFSCCFLIAFAAMLLVPKIHKRPELEGLFFLELGIATMYFDFYTTPILTFGLPMVYLYLLSAADEKALCIKRIGRDSLAWAAGYGFMWLAKLILTSLLTSASGIGTGFFAFMERIGIEKIAGHESMYNPIAPIRAVAHTLYSDRQGLLILFAAVAIAAIAILVTFLRRRSGLKVLLDHKWLILIAAMPVIWFMVAAEPTANHHWFQYRGIAVSFWAGLSYLQFTLAPGSQK